MKRSVYIIEDEALVAEDIRRNLIKLGYDVVGVAYDGKTAIQEMEDLAPDLILSDIRMRGIDGIEAIRQIKLRHRVAVVFVTAHSDMETLKRAQQVDPQGYILKPINSSDLEIAVEMAIHKHQKESELLESRHLLNTALGCVGDSVLFVGKDGAIINLNARACELLRADHSAAVGSHWSTVIRTGPRKDLERVTAMISRVVNTQSVARLFPLQIGANGDSEVIDGIIGPIRSGSEVVGLVFMLRRVTSANLDEAPIQGDGGLSATGNAKPYTLILIQPDDVDEYGVHGGVQQEVYNIISGELRPADLVTHYGASVFAANLPDTGLAEGRLMAEKIHEHLASHGFVGDRPKIQFSIGVAEAEPSAENDSPDLPVALFRRATWALNLARKNGGNQVVTWDPIAAEPMPEIQEDSERVADMGLLWHIVRSVSQTHDLDSLSPEIVGRIQKAFGLQACTLFIRSEERPLEFSAASVNGSPCQDYRDLRISRELRRSIEEVNTSSKMKVVPLNSDCNGQVYAVPLNSAEGKVGLILMLCRPDQAALSAEQIGFLETLADYVAMSLERALLLSRERDKIDGELRNFQKAVKQSELIYSSNVMRQLMDELRLVAPTEASVLITGESGTGKELLAQTIHGISGRRDKKLVVVDCSTIVPQLMESELFGYRKGAFTGAAHDSKGKVVEADGGTLFLDEIGELPMELQTKLLRFVQEGTFTPVGSTKTEKINVRLIVATNRDLASEVHAARFRSDLFYRLNVFKLESPPLRQRGQDVIEIARYFLGQFAAEYRSPPKALTSGAERVLLNYGWPGNVRELRNTILRAFIVSPPGRIDAEHLSLTESHNGKGLVAPAEPEPAAEVSSNPEPAVFESESDVLETLQVKLNELVQTCVSGADLDLGSWLENTCIRVAYRRAGEVSSRAAALLCIPESTFRRKLGPAQESGRVVDELDPDGRVWRCLDEVLVSGTDSGESVLTLIRDELGRVVLDFGLSRSKSAAIMGVSEPTFRKWMRLLEGEGV